MDAQLLNFSDPYNSASSILNLPFLHMVHVDFTNRPKSFLKELFGVWPELT